MRVWVCGCAREVEGNPPRYPPHLHPHTKCGRAGATARTRWAGARLTAGWSHPTTHHSLQRLLMSPLRVPIMMLLIDMHVQRGPLLKQPLESGVGHAAAVEVQRFELGQPGNLVQSRIGNRHIDQV